MFRKKGMKNLEIHFLLENICFALLRPLQLFWIIGFIFIFALMGGLDASYPFSLLLLKYCLKEE